MALHNRSTQHTLDSQLGLNFNEPASVRRIWPVHELVAEVRESIERAYSDVWVEGEISNYRPAPSGHLYFTLKDADAQLPIVLFRRQALLLRFRPEDGLHVLVRGRLSVYEQRGQMQLVAETMEPVGAGSLQLAFEQLKERLKAEGLFDAQRKRPLPAFPRTAGIITSPTGAVIRDFLNIVGRRHSGLNVLLYPVSVQGESAPAEIEGAITALNASGLVDLIVVARGGGSLEDLSAFNSERVARAIVASRLPVVSAVGHETDFTIADFAADLRAPTPSAAAELITEAQHRIAEHLATQEHRLERAVRFQLLHARRCFADLSVDRAESRIAALLHRLAQRLDDLVLRQESSLTEQIRERQSQITALAHAVLRHDPRRTIAQKREMLLALRARLERSLERVLQSSAFKLGSLHARLQSLSPLAVLDRGYALVLAADGTLIRSVTRLSPGDSLTTRLSDGAFTSRVENTTPTATLRGKKGNRTKP
ncbi:MAG TPA: exodeoxyribonuclease VII large subunit [Terracidiphilus sp.]|nr:exodeoxyribonuclease VII large subunit [Terracidiphilus sp.]